MGVILPHRVALSIEKFNKCKLFRTEADTHKVLNKFGLLLVFDAIIKCYNRSRVPFRKDWDFQNTPSLPVTQIH